MSVLSLIFTILQVLACVVLIAVVLFQSGKSSGLSGTISGTAETFFSKGKAKSLDSVLARSTKIVAGVFVLLTLLLNLIK